MTRSEKLLRLMYKDLQIKRVKVLVLALTRKAGRS